MWPLTRTGASSPSWLSAASLLPIACARAFVACPNSLIRSAPHSDAGTWGSANDCDRPRFVASLLAAGFVARAWLADRDDCVRCALLESGLSGDRRGDWGLVVVGPSFWEGAVVEWRMGSAGRSATRGLRGKPWLAARRWLWPAADGCSLKHVP